MGRDNDSESLPLCSDHDKMHHLQLACHSVVLALGLPLNAIALWFFLRVVRLRTVVAVYMANLAACDLFFTLALPLRLYYYANHRWDLGNVPCQLAGSLFQLNMYGSCLFLAAISVDRFLALAHPLSSRAFRCPRVAWSVCGAVWALIVLGSVPVALAHDTSRCLLATNGSRVVEIRCFESFSGEAWKRELLPLVGLAETLGFLLPLSTVLVCSVKILAALARVDGRAERSGGRRRRRKTIFLLMVNALIFVACFVPYNVALGVYALSRSDVAPLSTHSQKELRLALQLTILLSGTNCCLDPLVYYFSTEGFRTTLRAGTSAWSRGKSEPLKGKEERGRTQWGARRARCGQERREVARMELAQLTNDERVSPLTGV
ncbi:lysophosphatidic acid receptor 5-like [Amblyraja radiata]|uniref:lysophosphatidic acid receptor 5-like n=1 Tax=Amblyraja radiata TaxID=386614 RepID=UPI001402747D|nr:lysophosphatidic acid receptor 5-like [Amblyraja radiata]